MDSVLSGKTILIAEDESDLREVIAADLERFNCKVLQANNGEDALKIVQEKNVDIVLSDVRMPKKDGIELLKNIRQSNPLFPVVILISGYANISEAEAIGHGAFAFIDKPIPRTELLSLLESAAICIDQNS